MRKIPRRLWQAIRQPWRLAVPLKRFLIALTFLLAAAGVYYWAINNMRDRRHLIVGVVILWLVTAYYLLPRIHRLLSRIYVPNYFIGRARTADGLLADPVNLAVRGSEQQLKAAMEQAGWSLADPVTPTSALRIVVATLSRRSYDQAPVSDLYVYGRKQAYAFQKEVDGNPAKRHHVRFWRVPAHAYLPGGYQVDWVAAASYDDAVGFSLFTLQITHSIDGDVDAERDLVVRSLQLSKVVKKTQHIEHFFPGYQHRNGGGDKFFTDGSMTIVSLP